MRDIWCRSHWNDNWLKFRIKNLMSRKCKRYAHDLISMCFELILYVKNERRQRFDEKFDLKSIAMKSAINDEANEQLNASFLDVWYVVLNLKSRRFELLMFLTKWSSDLFFVSSQFRFEATNLILSLIDMTNDLDNLLVNAYAINYWSWIDRSRCNKDEDLKTKIEKTTKI